MTPNRPHPTITPDPNRPYPEGIPWDEAYRQRQRADQAEQTIQQLKTQLNKLNNTITKYQTQHPPNP